MLDYGWPFRAPNGIAQASQRHLRYCGRCNCDPESRRRPRRANANKERNKPSAFTAELKLECLGILAWGAFDDFLPHFASGSRTRCSSGVWQKLHGRQMSESFVPPGIAVRSCSRHVLDAGLARRMWCDDPAKASTGWLWSKCRRGPRLEQRERRGRWYFQSNNGGDPDQNQRDCGDGTAFSHDCYQFWKPVREQPMQTVLEGFRLDVGCEKQRHDLRGP